MHLPLESLADNSCFHCTKILFHAMENKVSYYNPQNHPSTFLKRSVSILRFFSKTKRLF